MDILDDDNQFIQYQLNHYFKNYNNNLKIYNYVDVVNDYINNLQNNNYFTCWIEIIHRDSIDIFFIENSNIMCNKTKINDDYNLEIIKAQSLLIHSSINKFPFLVIRSGWDQSFIPINQPCLLRTSRRNNNDFGVLIPDSTTQRFKVLKNFQNNFANINFNNKKNNLIWRGVISGDDNSENKVSYKYKINEDKPMDFKFYSRRYFINKFYKQHDVKFLLTNSDLLKERELTIPKEQGSIYIDTKDMATTYKFQIALNGNSFAGSFGWNLLSNSVVFHPNYDDNFYTYLNPRQNIDYVPIQDNYEDLNDKINYFINNNYEAEIIARNGRKYVDKLLQFTQLLTKMTMNKIYSLYDQGTMNEAINLLNSKFTKVSVKFHNNNFITV